MSEHDGLELGLGRTPLLLEVDVLGPSRQPGLLSVAFDDVPVARNDRIKVPLGDGFGVGGIGLDILGQRGREQAMQSAEGPDAPDERNPSGATLGGLAVLLCRWEVEQQVGFDHRFAFVVAESDIFVFKVLEVAS